MQYRDSQDELMVQTMMSPSNQEYSSSAPLFFILGRGRSGTTLLREILNAHPGIVVAPEAMFIILLYNLYKKINDWDQHKLLSFYNNLWLENRLENWRIEKELLKKRILAMNRDVSFSHLCKLPYEFHAQGLGITTPELLGDKNPHYSLFSRDLVKLFPDSRFIHVVRDYRDNVLSYKRVNFDLKNTAALAYRWRRYNQEILYTSIRYPERFYLLKFEELIIRPEENIEELCAFLGVDYVPQMLEFYNKEADTATLEWHKNLRRAFDPTRTYVWKIEMAASDILQADYVCKDLGQKFGYEIYGEEQTGNHLWTILGILTGWLYTVIEKMVFHIPLLLRAKLIRLYRRWTKTVA